MISFSFRTAFSILILAYAIPNLLKAESLSPAEQTIRDYSHSQTEAQISLLKKIVNINSGSTNTAGVHKVGYVLQDQFKQLGFKTYWAEEPKNLHRAGALIAEHSGTKGKRLLLIGHLDTVFPKTSAFQTFKRKKNSASGPGVIDAKGGDVVILFALKALQKAHALEDANITVVLTGDEEDSGKPTSISRKSLFAVAEKNDIALDFECGISLNTGTIARRGVSSWTLETHGNEVHSAGIFEKNAGFGAIFELSRILNDMREELSKEKYVTISPNVLLGGSDIQVDGNAATGNVKSKKNVVAKMALAKGDLRFLTERQQHWAQEKIRRILAKNLPGTRATIEFKDGIPGMPPTKNSLRLLEQFSDVNVALGLGKIEPLDPGRRGAGDISHIADKMFANLAGLGPVGEGAHSDKESVELDSLVIATQRAGILIYRLTR